MAYTKSRIIAAAALFFSSTLAQGTTPGQSQPLGCFSSADSLSDQGYFKFQSSGYCKDACVKLNKAVFGLSQGSHCYCGDTIPAKSAAAPTEDCNISCLGFPNEKCGGQSAFNVFLSGTSDNPPQADAPSSTSKSVSTTPTPTSGTPSTITQPGQTVVVTASGQPGITVIPSASSSPSSGGSGASKAGIAAGVVVAIVLVGAIILGVWLFIRNRKKRAIEEEYRRNVAINSFSQKSHHPSSSMSDSRLEPSVIGQRRMSDGSIADNQDYSRRILKVTNPS